EQFLFLMAGTSVHTGDWGAWIKEMDAIEEGEPLHPFYRAAFEQVRAQLAAARGDKREADLHVERSAAAEQLLDSGMVTASDAVSKAQVLLLRGEWTEAARLALEAAQDQNFSMEGPLIASQAATAGGLSEDLVAAITAFADSGRRGRVWEGSLAAAEAGQAARAGRLDEARAGFRRALGLFRDSGDLLNEAITGLIWGLMAGSRDPEAAAAEKAGEAFFTERGAAATVADFRAAFVPLAEAAPVGAPAPSGVATEAGSPAARP